MTAAIAPKVRRKDFMAGVHEEEKPLSIRASSSSNPEPFVDDSLPIYETPRESNDFGFHIKPALIDGLESPFLSSAQPNERLEGDASRLRGMSMQSEGSLGFPSPLLAPVMSADPSAVPLSLLIQETFGDDLFEEFERDALALADSSFQGDLSPASGGETTKSIEASSASSYETPEDLDKVMTSMDDVEMLVT
jgi:hypothetical protein